MIHDRYDSYVEWNRNLLRFGRGLREGDDPVPNTHSRVGIWAYPPVVDLVVTVDDGVVKVDMAVTP